MLLTRFLTALVVLPVVVAAIYVGGPWLTAVVACVLALAYFEFANLMGEGKPWAGPYPVGFLLVVLLPIDSYLTGGRLAGPMLSLALLLTLGWQVVGGRGAAPASRWCIGVAGAVYLGWLGRYLVLLRQLPLGLQWLVLALVTTWITDSGAYFAGRAFGRHKMAPRLSPGKTWEGAVAGWFIGVAGGALVGFLLGLGWVHGAAVGILASTAAPFGDLSVSMFKRQVGAKDTGSLLPGHGGMWDRLDSPLFVVPLVYLYALWFGGV